MGFDNYKIWMADKPDAEMMRQWAAMFPAEQRAQLADDIQALPARRRRLLELESLFNKAAARGWDREKQARAAALMETSRIQLKRMDTAARTGLANAIQAAKVREDDWQEYGAPLAGLAGVASVIMVTAAVAGIIAAYIVAGPFVAALAAFAVAAVALASLAEEAARFLATATGSTTTNPDGSITTTPGLGPALAQAGAGVLLLIAAGLFLFLGGGRRRG